MELKDITEKIFDGTKIIEQHYLKENFINQDSILFLQPEDFQEGKLNINDNTKYIKESTYQKYYGSHIKEDSLYYNDFIFDKSNFQLYLIKEDFKNIIIPSEKFLIVRPNQYLANVLKNENAKKYFNQELKKIYEGAFPNKLELIRKIYIPNNFSEIEDIIYTRPDKKRLVDLTKINIKQGLMTLDQVIKRLKLGEIHIDSYFQRKKDLWDADVKSRFIEALIVRQPVPAFYFDATNNDKWLIVDGLQRLSTLKEFVIDKTLQLNDLYYLPEGEYENATFDKLPRSAQRNIEEYEIMVYKIEPPTPKEVKYKIFRSINTSALVLSNQEIRHSLNHKINDNDKSSPAEYIEQLANTAIFKTILEKNKIKSDRMEDRELALRYIAFRSTPYENYTPKMTEFLDDTMTKIYRVSDNDLEKYKIDFGEALFCIDKIFGDTAFRKSMFGMSGDELINNLFETWTYVFAIITDAHRKKLILKSSFVKQETIKLGSNNRYISAIETKNAYTIENVNIRFITVKNFILNIVK